LLSFDIDESHTLSRDEFLHGPLYLKALDTDTKLSDAFFAAADHRSTPPDVSELYRSLYVPDPSESIHAAFIGLSETITRRPPNPNDPKVESSYAAAAAQVAASVGATTLDTSKPTLPEEARFQQTKRDLPSLGGLASLAGGAGGALALAGGAAMAGGALGATQKGPTDYPKSNYGTPTYSDEECVICQFAVQLMQKRLFKRLSNGDDPDVNMVKIKEVNSQVEKMDNGRGIVRINDEDVMQEFCAPDNIPEIFYPYCTSLNQNLYDINHYVYFGFGADAVCEMANMCDQYSYFSQKTSVHTPSRSKFYNMGRGTCGMMGGVHERGGALASTMCSAMKLAT